MNYQEAKEIDAEHQGHTRHVATGECFNRVCTKAAGYLNCHAKAEKLVEALEKALKASIQMRNFSSPKKLEEELSWRDNDDLATKFAEEAFGLLDEWHKENKEAKP